jgi:hypothetical protein
VIVAFTVIACHLSWTWADDVAKSAASAAMQRNPSGLKTL